MKKVKKRMTLTKLVESYNRDKELAPCYVRTLGASVRRFEKYLQRPATVADLNYQTVNAWMQHECEEGRLAARTRSGGRTDIMTLWRYSGRKLKKSKVRRVKVPRKNPEAWTFDQLNEVATASDKLGGVLSNGIPRSLYFRTIFFFAYETGLRRRDIWSFDFEAFVEQRSAVTQHKTGNVHVIGVTDATMADLESVHALLNEKQDPHARTPLRWPESESQFYYWAKKLRGIAGVDEDVRNRVLQHSRRTGATDVALAGGAPWQYLGHTHEGLDRKAYVDALKTAKTTLPARTRENAPISHRREATISADNREEYSAGSTETGSEPVDENRKRDTA